jgi:hypothetical protein
MSNFVLLNNIAHKNLRVIRDHVPQYGDNDMSAITFPQEFRAIQNEYPIFFQKNPENGKFIPVASKRKPVFIRERMGCQLHSCLSQKKAIPDWHTSSQAGAGYQPT